MSKSMKGVYSMCPPKPKYFVTWDVNQVLSFFENMGPSEKVNSETINVKTSDFSSTYFCS